jgi:hypothetical protein
MSVLLQALKEIINPRRLDEQRPLVLQETQRTMCRPIRVHGDGDHVAVRLEDQDYLQRLLAVLPKEVSVRKLPDYLIFADPPARARRSRSHRDLLLQVVVCELKSGQAGAEAALPQLRCGKLLAKHLIGLSALHMSVPRAEPLENIEVCYCGLVAVPQALQPKGLTRAGTGLSHDDLPSAMRVHRHGDGAPVDLGLLVP